MLITLFTNAQTESKVDYDAFEKLVTEVKPHRAKRLIGIEEFNNMSKKRMSLFLIHVLKKCMMQNT